MATFDVFVEGPVGGGPEALDKLARIMAKRYGLPAPDLVARMAKGRVRVKGNVDETTANTYARDLESIGARVTIAESSPASQRQTGGISLRTPPSGVPIADASPARPAPTARAATPSVSPNTIPRGATPRPATPVAGTPRPATPVPGTPRAATPVSSMPRSATPVSGTPRPATPVAGTPVSASPRPATPVAGTPVSASPRPATPVAGTPVSAAPQSGRSAEPFARPSPLPARPAQPEPPDGPVLPSGFTAMDLPRPSAGRHRVATPASGLAAAFSADAPATGLGALEGASLDGDSLALAALDGSEDPKPQISFAPTPAAKPKADRPKDVPLDLFEPPEAAAASFELDLATDELDARKKPQPPPPAPAAGPAIALAVEAATRGSGPPPTGASQPLKRPDRPNVPTPPAGVAASTDPAATAAGETPRWRFAAGVLVAVVLGFVPAHCVASAREDSADAKIDDAVVLLQEQSTSPDAYDKLDEFRDEQLANKRAAHRSIALASMLIWAVAGAALGFGWFRLVPWDRLPRRDQSSS